jgi:hypothetical protein
LTQSPGNNQYHKTASLQEVLHISKYGTAALTAEKRNEISQDQETILSFDLGQFKAILGGTATWI